MPPLFILYRKKKHGTDYIAQYLPMSMNCRLMCGHDGQVPLFSGLNMGIYDMVTYGI